MTRIILAACLAVLPFASAFACVSSDRVNAAATKPTSPANGAADYKDSPGGPHVAPGVPNPNPGAEPNGAVDDQCPPKCAPDGSWKACGLKKPRGSGCTGCTPKCKGDGWYDCSGVLIVAAKCG